MSYGTSGSEHALMVPVLGNCALTLPVGLATALVKVDACMVLVVLGMLSRLKDERGNPMGTTGGVTVRNAIAGQHLPM